MGQKLRDDKIGTLSHNAGVISLTSSWLTIGGQQYNPSSLSRIISTDVTMAANTLYMIYAVLSAGVPELRISTNVNSVGPAGFVAWKLVGAFYANGNSSVGFGSFVNIEGSPETYQAVSFLPTFTTDTGTMTNSVLTGTYMRRGQFIKCFWRLEYSGATGTWTVLNAFVPNNILLDSTSLPATVVAGEKSLGSGFVNGGTPNSPINVNWLDSQRVRPRIATVSGATVPFSDLSNTTLNSGQSLDFEFEVAVQGWNSKPLKDL